MDTNEIINELRERVAYLEGRERGLLQSVQTLKSACNQIAADGTELVSKFHDDNERLKVTLRNMDTVAAASMGVSGQIKKAAFELGYKESMEATELEYLIETAKASVMVNQKNVELAAQLVAVQDSVVHGKCANSEPCATFCEAIATRKMFKQLQLERDALAEWKNKIEFLAACAVVCEGKLSDKTMSEMMQISSAHDAEVAAKAVLEFSAKLLVNQKVDVIDCAKLEADQLRAKAGA